jgi:hypothetical protein
MAVSCIFAPRYEEILQEAILVTLTHAGQLSRDKLSEQDAKVSTLLPGMDTESQLL